MYWLQLSRSVTFVSEVSKLDTVGFTAIQSDVKASTFYRLSTVYTDVQCMYVHTQRKCKRTIVPYLSARTCLYVSPCHSVYHTTTLRYYTSTSFHTFTRDHHEEFLVRNAVRDGIFSCRNRMFPARTPLSQGRRRQARGRSSREDWPKPEAAWRRSLPTLVEPLCTPTRLRTSTSLPSEANAGGLFESATVNPPINTYAPSVFFRFSKMKEYLKNSEHFWHIKFLIYHILKRIYA